MEIIRLKGGQKNYSRNSLLVSAFLQASSDLSILDYDIPYAIGFIIAGGIELLTTIGIMASVTWQVLIVATFSIVASKYVQVGAIQALLFFIFIGLI